MAEVLVDPTTALGGDRDQHLEVFIHSDGRGRGQGFVFGGLLRLALDLDLVLVALALVQVVDHFHLLQLVERELFRAVFAQQAHRVGAALAAMAHQVGAAHAGVLHRFQLGSGRATLAGEAEHRAVFGFGDQRHDVVQEGAALLHFAVHLDQVLVVDAGDQHRVDLGEHAARGEHFQAEHLALVQNPGGLVAGHALVVPEDPGVDLLAHGWVHHVDGDGHVVDVVFADLVDLIRQCQAVGGQAELDVGRLLLQHAEGLEGLGRVGQRIAGAGDAEHRHLRNLAGHGDDFFHRLFGRELLRDHAGAALVAAVVFAVAVVALDVAGRRHGDVHAGVVVVGLFGIARVVLDLVPDFLRHVVRAVGRATTGFALTAGGATTTIGGGQFGRGAQGFDLADADVGLGRQ
ncbi:hypothetical protein Y695_02530 [Hydrogenophaga sp. T4]|nr:hypothetical protein Y695_02530 [Hydrogenophaga sp. T4]